MLVAGNGGRRSSGGGALAMASLHCLNRARYELHEVTTELFQKKREDERDPNYSDHGELELRRGQLMAAAADLANALLPGSIGSTRGWTR
jgi:uncharacterized protein YjhX (UPF0386 family)